MDWTAFYTAISPALFSLLQLILVLGTPIAIAAAIKYFNAHAQGAQWVVFRGVVADAVKAAQQYVKSPDGQAKKTYALSIIQTWLAANHVSVDVAVIEAALESSVFSEIKGGASLPVGTSAGAAQSYAGALSGADDVAFLQQPSKGAS